MTRSICYHGFLGGPRSMGRVGFYLFNYLRKNPNYEAFILPYSNDYMASRWEADISSRIVEKSGVSVDQFVSFCSVLDARSLGLGKVNSTWLFYELSTLPPSAVDDVNSNDLVYVTSSFVKSVFIESKVSVPLTILGHGYDPALYSYRPRVPSDSFNFLCIAENTPRKNLPLLIECFERAFNGEQNVRLILKLGLHGEGAIRSHIRNPDLVELRLGDYKDEREMVRLYHEAHCFVLPTRGEGFGMPVLEAMATGLPVIVTNYSGHLDFCDPQMTHLIQNRGLVASDPTCFPHIESQWGDPDPDHLIFLMRSVYENYAQAQAMAKAAHVAIQNEWTWDAQLAKAFP